MREYEVEYSIVKSTHKKISSAMRVARVFADNEKSLRQIIERCYPECSIKKVIPFSFYDD